jgi:subtilisin family serine protease
MTQSARVGLVVCVLVSVILVGGGASAKNVDNLRRIVKFLGINLTNPEDLATARSVVAASGSSEVHTLWLINALAVQLPAAGADQALAALLRNPLVEGVFDDSVSMADGAICIAPVPAPSSESYPWGLQKIDVPAVDQKWPALQGAGVMVAVLDTGIDLSHPELSSRIVGGYNALAGGGSYADDNGHGTHMAGIIAAASNSLGVIGAAPQATFAAVKVLDQYGAGYLSDLIAGLQWVYGYNNGILLVKLVNLSLGFSTDSQPLQRAIQSLYNSGVIIVASAGNLCAQSPSQDEGGGDACQGGLALACDPSQTAVKYPAAYPWVLAVTATDYYDHVTAYSVSGPQVDVCAPGGSKATGIRILSTTTGGGYGESSGTSQAAAHVTGAAALALQLKPGLSFEQVRSVLQTTATNLGYPSTQQGAGRINVKKMVQALQ